MATPIVYAESQIPPGEHSGQGDSLMIFKDARVEQQNWVFADSQFEGWWANVKHGLGAFNSDTVDHAWIYPNYGHGFLDPLMGVALWVGVAIVGLAIIRRRREDEGALLMVGGFLVLWLSFALLINKAPNYTRLLIALPFVSYLVVEALRWATNRWRSVDHVPQLIVGVFVAAVVALNVSAAWDYVQLGRKEGEPIGSTGRYVRAHSKPANERFYIVSGNTTPYYVWGDVSASLDRVSLFARGNQVQPVDPSGLQSFTAVPPFRLLMRREVWQPAVGAARRPLSARTDPQHHARRRAGRARSPVLSGQAPAPDRHWFRSSPLAHSSQAWRFPSLSACCVPRIVPMPQKQ